MAWRSSGSSNKELWDNLRKNGILTNDRIYDALVNVDRKNYCRDEDHRQAYQDCPQSIGHGATISAPHMHAWALNLLEAQLQPGMKALDVGSGSGYLTVVMGRLVGSEGKAIGIEHLGELVDFANENVRKGDSDLKDSVEFHETDGRNGWPDEKPYHAIHVGAAAPKVPEALIDQLAKGGRMIIPVGPQHGDQHLMQIDRDNDGKLHEKTITGVRYVPLGDKSQYY